MTDTLRARLQAQQADLRAKDLWRTRHTLTSAQQPLVQYDGESVVNFSSNDYLGLANHPALIEAAVKASQQWGVGSGASHLVCGHQTPHHQLEESLAEYVGAERALVFSSGYMANLAVCTALLAKPDLILQDKLNHASLIDGARLSDAQFKRYAHADLRHARALLSDSQYRHCLILTDGVFSMDGDVAPLAELKALVDDVGGLLVVDDAHGFACVGDSGRGSLEQCGLTPQGNVLMMGTLGKALGNFGAFVAGDETYIEQLIQSARSYIYTTALPPAVAATTDAALSLVRTQGDELRAVLAQRISYFKTRAEQANLRLMPSKTAIQPLVVGDESVAMALSHYLFDAGFYVTAIRPPTVPTGSARLRFTLCATHTEQQIDELFNALACVSLDG